MSFFSYRPYVPVAVRRMKAAKELAKLSKKGGQPTSPVHIEGRTIARSFWGKAWCENLEGYSDYENRLPRGRTYVRNGSVVDLKIAKGEVVAYVSGSELYTVKIKIAAVAAAKWKAICADCAGGIDSLVALLQGRLSKPVMERVCRQGDGLFPAPKDIELSCSCPDSARMCKHVAAVLYGVGARLDDKPEHLFSLRAVDTADLISSAGQGELRGKKAPAGAKVLAGDDVSALFGLEMADMEAAPADAPVAAAQGKPARKAKPPARPPNAAPEKPAGAKLKGKTAAQPAKAPPKRPAGAQPKSKPATPARAARSAMASKPARARRQPTAP